MPKTTTLPATDAPDVNCARQAFFAMADAMRANAAQFDLSDVQLSALIDEAVAEVRLEMARAS